MKRLPTVSIIMPVRDEARYIERSLGAVAAQDYPQHLLEIIVADGMSTDGTRSILQNLRAEHPNLRVIDNPRKIVSTGLNAALGLARGEMIIRVDGHCEIARDYVRCCVAHLLGKDVDGVGGPIETMGETSTAQSIALAMSSRFGVGDSAFRTVRDRPMLVDTVAFPAYRREAVLKAGPFDEELVRNQDDEYNYRLRDSGGKLLLAPDVHSRYYSRSSLGRLWKQYFQYGHWKVRVLQKHIGQMCLRQFVPPAFVLALLGGTCIFLLRPHSGVLLAFVGGAYALANLASSVWVASHRGWRHLPLLPVVFAILHIGYGFGFLTGLIRFAHRWRDREGKLPGLSGFEGWPSEEEPLPL